MSVDLSLIERSACDVVELLREQALSPHDLLDTLAAHWDTEIREDIEHDRLRAAA